MILVTNSWPKNSEESEKTRQRIRDDDRKVFTNPESFWKSGWSEKCPNYLKSARMICKASGQSERCPNDLANVQMMHKMCFTLFLHILPNKDSDSFFDWSKLLLKVSSFSDAETPNNYFWDLYTLIWTIQTLRRGKVIFKCICIESLLETHNESLSQFLQSFITSLSLADYEDSIQTQMRTFYSE